jgi:cell division protein FtsX
MKQLLNEQFLRMQKLAGIITENQVNNSYVIKDDEDFYTIDKQKALDYLSQFDDDDVDAEQFIDDDEGWGEFEQYLDNVELMSDKELEDAMREEMSFYYFSNPDSI